MFIANLDESVHHIIDTRLVCLQRGQGKGIGNHLSILSVCRLVSDANKTGLHTWLAKGFVCWALHRMILAFAFPAARRHCPAYFVKPCSYTVYHRYSFMVKCEHRSRSNTNILSILGLQSLIQLNLATPADYGPGFVQMPQVGIARQERSWDVGQASSPAVDYHEQY